MRRNEREITDRTEIDAVIAGALVLRLGLCREGQPYVVPVSFGYDGAALYFHTAPTGMKLDFLAANPQVCFELEGAVQLLPHPELACGWSFAYTSVIGFGHAVELDTPDKKRRALDQIMNHYAAISRQTAQKWEYNPGTLMKTRLWRVEIDRLTGKQSRQKS